MSACPSQGLEDVEDIQVGKESVMYDFGYRTKPIHGTAYTRYATSISCIGHRYKLLHFSLEIPMAYEFNGILVTSSKLTFSFVIYTYYTPFLLGHGSKLINRHLVNFVIYLGKHEMERTHLSRRA